MRLIAISTLLALTSLATPAGAHDLNGTKVTFFGAVPCAIVCSYWVDNGFTPCEAPFPPGSYLDRVTSPAPSAHGKITVLQGTLDSEIDWDGFFCGNDASRQLLAQGASQLGDDCDGEIQGFRFGCHEDMSTLVAAGQTVIFRAYNWSDAAPAEGEYAFLLI